MEEMGNTIESVRIMARDSVNAKEKELTDLMTKQVNTIKSFVDENIEDMQKRERQPQPSMKNSSIKSNLFAANTLKNTMWNLKPFKSKPKVLWISIKTGVKF